MTLEQMLAQLAKRQKKSKNLCIYTAYDYMRTLDELSSDHEQFKNMLELRKSADWKDYLTKAKQALTYKNEDTGVLGGSKQDDANNIVSFGAPKRKDVQLKRGAIMEIECVLTSKNKDRDGDILEPAGANLDEKMPFLWQHIPVQPIGVYTGLIHRDENIVQVGYSIIDNLLGRDAAQLIEFGALRISHGFKPEVFKWIEEEPDSNGMCFGGFHVEKYEVMEGSAVSIPANKDAVITAFSRQKLHHPLVKLWAGNLNENRTKTYDTNGFDPKTFNPTINVNVNLGDALNTNKGNTLPPAPKPKKDDDAPDKPVDDKPADDKPADDKPKDDDNKDDGKTKSVMLGDIIDALNEVAGMEGVPSEAANRCQVVLGMLEEVGAVLEKHSEIFADSMANQDLSNMLTSIGDVISGIVDNLQKVCNEVETIAGIDGLPQAAVSKLSEITEQVNSVKEAISAMMAATQTDDNNTSDAGLNTDVVVDQLPMGASTDAEEKATELLGSLLSGNQLTKETANLLYGCLAKQ